MKIIFQAFVCSVIINVIYWGGMLLAGYIKTVLYKPDTSGWNKVEMLQTEVAFSGGISPIIYLYSFAAVAVICGIILFFYKKLLT